MQCNTKEVSAINLCRGDVLVDPTKSVYLAVVGEWHVVQQDASDLKPGETLPNEVSVQLVTLQSGIPMGTVVFDAEKRLTVIFSQREKEMEALAARRLEIINELNGKLSCKHAECENLKSRQRDDMLSEALKYERDSVNAVNIDILGNAGLVKIPSGKIPCATGFRNIDELLTFSGRTGVGTESEPDRVDACDILHECRVLINQRGEQNGYDNGQERSAARIAAVFNALKGTSLSELDIWDLMLILKLVRAQTAKGNDSRRDLVSYAALGAECSENGDLK